MRGFFSILTILCVLTSQAWAESREKDIQARVGYGITFTPATTIWPSSSMWQHVYAIQLPTILAKAGWEVPIKMCKTFLTTVCNPRIPCRDNDDLLCETRAKEEVVCFAAHSSKEEREFAEKVCKRLDSVVKYMQILRYTVDAEIEEVRRKALLMATSREWSTQVKSKRA